eukprot:c15120_g1_i2.p1 GENE.c15120_g1_i2~~c15120_g1_i2.p1  ORF type:complete len:874 (+),score=214.08 c15120_g1_i2:37-2622(+)
MAEQSVIRIPPFSYIHVLDTNLNKTELILGPLTYTRPDHFRLVKGPEKMLVIPPRGYCIIRNPVVKVRDAPVMDEVTGQFKLRYGDSEVRKTQERFPLYPGEEVELPPTLMEVIELNTARRLRAKRDFVQRLDDGTAINRTAGDEWLLVGPCVFTPMVEADVVESVSATVIRTNQALRLRARRNFVDAQQTPRCAGEEWLFRREGAYLPTVDEFVVGLVSAYTLTEKKAIQLRATRTATDVHGVRRQAGEEWLVTLEHASTHIPDVYEEFVQEVPITTLTNREYAVVVHPVDKATGRPQFGRRELRVGERSFFLLPGESLEDGIQPVYVLGEEEALVLRAREAFADDTAVPAVVRRPGDLWMIRGPREYFPRVEVEIVDRREAIVLDESEGIYVRNLHTGAVRSVRGQSYLLCENEVLWAKELTPGVEALLSEDKDPLADRMVHGGQSGGARKIRDKTRVVSYRVPHNAAIQVYDYKAREARVVFGPDLVMLEPDEQFTELVLSGDKPKRPNVIRSLVLLLGPDFATDIVTVETSDHARLSLQLSYNWRFEVDKSSRAAESKIFSISDFIGDACKAIASRVRGAVAQVPFDEFHKTSAHIIRASLFGMDPATGKIRDYYRFAENNLVITSIDIQSVEPVDQRTRDSLQKSVQLAIKITTESQEATAKHNAARVEQTARAELEQRRIIQLTAAETERKKLLELQSLSAAVASSGQASAEAVARAKAAEISGQAAVLEAKLKVQAAKIEADAELARLKAHQAVEVAHMRQLNELELQKLQELAVIEASKFKATVDAIGSDTIAAMARAGPETQSKLLQGLGIKSMLVTDGNSPVNLFSLSNGILGGLPAKAVAGAVAGPAGRA